MDPKSAHKSYYEGHKNFIPEDRILRYGFLFVLPGLLLISVLYLVFYQTQLLYRPQQNITAYPTPYPTITSEVMQPPDTSTWKTYTNTDYNFIFQYPPHYKLIENKNKITTTVTQIVRLERDIKLCKGCGYANNDEVQKGQIINISIEPKKFELTPEGFKKAYGIDVDTKPIQINNANGIEVFPKSTSGIGSQGRSLNFPNKGNVIHIGFAVGFDVTKEEFQYYSSQFDQILSTFRFD